MKKFLVMKKLLVACAYMVVSSSAAFAGTCTILPGMGGKWSEDTSWKEGAVPKAGDAVIIDAAETAAKGIIIEATKADVDFLETTGVGDIVFANISSKNRNPVLQVTVGPDELASYSGVITNSVSSDTYSGYLVKKGEGHLKLTHDKGNYHLAIVMQVDEGILQLPSVNNTYRNQHYVKLVVNSPGILWTLTGTENNSARAYLHDGIMGDGMVTNPAPKYATTLMCEASKASQRTFSGILAGNVRVEVNKNYGQIFTRSENPTTGTHTLDEGAELGLVSIGGTTGGNSNIGSVGKGSFTLGNNTTVRYLGSGEVSYATFNAAEALQRFTLNGGPNGGYVHCGTVDFSSATASNASLVLDGTNRTACTLASGLVKGPKAESMRLVKRGSGTWNVQENASSTYDGLVAVEDGTLTFDTLSEAGYPCALGWASALQDDAGTVDYAVLLGTASTTGTLASASSGAAATHSRPLALLGDGRLSSGTASLAWKDVSAAAVGVHALTLDGAATGSVLSDVRDGDVGRVKIVKEGSGSWTLNGALDFTGGIEVRGGSLAVASADVTTNHFSWFRALFKKNSGSSELDVARWGLFDKNGLAQATNLVYNTEANGRPWKLQPGETAYFHFLPSFDYANFNSTQRVLDNCLFLPQNDTAFLRVANKAYKPLSPQETNSWIGVVARLPEGSDPVVSYDIGVRFDASHNYGIKAPTDWSIEGSADGVHWQLLAEESNWPTNTQTAKYWLHSGKAFYSKANTNPWPLATPYEVTPASFPQGVDSILIATNATLTAARTVETRKIVVEAAGGGAVSGFKLADDGVIDVVGVPAKGAFEVALDLSQVELPDGVPILVNGQVDRREVTLSADRKSIKGIPPGLMIMIK